LICDTASHMFHTVYPGKYPRGQLNNNLGRRIIFARVTDENRCLESLSENSTVNYRMRAATKAALGQATLIPLRINRVFISRWRC